MTLTAPGCGMGPFIVDEVQTKFQPFQMLITKSVSVDLVFDPPWSQEMMSDEARLQVGLLNLFLKNAISSLHYNRKQRK